MSFSQRENRRRFPRSKPWVVVGIVCPVILLGVMLVVRTSYLRTPRSKALETGLYLAKALQTNSRAEVLRWMRQPLAFDEDSNNKLTRRLCELLVDEISAEGVAALQHEGTFGTLRNIFPAECEQWAAAFGVSVDDCVAFRMERNGIRAELVLVKHAEGFLVLRCNNVKQMALLGRR